MISDSDRRIANVAARVAARNGLPITVCPWKTETDNRQRALLAIWVRTFLRHRPGLRDAADHPTRH